jgi:hypothetical protein
MSSQKRDVRSLVTLMESASTARVLNLLSARVQAGADADYAERPLFKSRILNNCIILKHRLRKHEADSLAINRSVATKILFPIDPSDLSLGARFLFVGQQGFDVCLEEATGQERFSEEAVHDMRLIAALDEIPSLDPFLTREHLRRRGFNPSNAYFNITRSDIARMFSHVEEEIWPLVRMCYGGDAVDASRTKKLVSKILSNDLDADFAPLRLTLRLSESEYQEGMFCWKGFLYYKWALNTVLPGAVRVSDAIGSIRTRGVTTSETSAYIAEARQRLQQGVRGRCEQVRTLLKVYDDAFEGLTQRSDPNAFRDFLLSAPALFSGIGERLGAVQHIVSFWNYWAPTERKTMVSGDELAELFQDFEQSLGLVSKRQLAWA